MAKDGGGGGRGGGGGKAARFAQMGGFERDAAIEKYMVGKVTVSDVESVSRLLRQVRSGTGRKPGKAAKKVARAINTMSPSKFSQWWLAGGAYK